MDENIQMMSFVMWSCYLNWDYRYRNKPPDWRRTRRLPLEMLAINCWPRWDQLLSHTDWKGTVFLKKLNRIKYCEVESIFCWKLPDINVVGFDWTQADIQVMTNRTDIKTIYISMGGKIKFRKSDSFENFLLVAHTNFRFILFYNRDFFSGKKGLSCEWAS